jgi:peroxiredoxin
MQRGSFRTLGFAVILAAFALGVSAQPKPGAKTYYFDYTGNAVSNNEFVDIRMANSHYPDATIVKTLPDGSTEFHLQKIPQEGMIAPQFTVRTVDGRTIASSELRGKVVVLSFWFIGCAACHAIKPKLNEFRSKFSGSDDVVFLAMTADPKDEVKKYLEKEQFDYLQATDAGAVMGSFVFRTYPKNIVIDKQGKIAYWRSTVKAWDTFESVVRTELAK